MNIGKVIADWRRHRNMRQNKLAEKADIPVSVLSKIENGKRNPNFTHLEKISKIIGLPVPILMFLSMEKGDVPDEKREEFEHVYRNFKSLIGDVFK